MSISDTSAVSVAGALTAAPPTLVVQPVSSTTAATTTVSQRAIPLSAMPLARGRVGQVDPVAVGHRRRAQQPGRAGVGEHQRGGQREPTAAVVEIVGMLGPVTFVR